MIIVYHSPVLLIADRPHSISALATRPVSALPGTNWRTRKMPSAAPDESAKKPANAHPAGN
ncbi:hypothetical protein [Arthrobacter sp. B1I2]|uniref:hypothetical protein n=1 Tax=Arthrobacter sp. B1I2 TaxID=3042263 RepID=UPI002786F3D2|nr:hypothetical protein [Arthrobacter sp. B1I2]MDQ0732404.1 hypothetical protein [Arthrobacter sp. B1I2]